MFTRTPKLLIAITSIVAVLFTQLAVAAYACPIVEGPGKIIAAAIAGDVHAAMPDCEMRETGNPNLCLQHCQAGEQSVQTLSQVEAPPFAAISALAVIEPVQLMADLLVTAESAVLERETSPPPLIRFGFLRI